MSGLLPLLALTRMYSVVPLALLSYGVGVAMGADEGRVLAASVAIACALAGGYAYNDLRDRVTDAINRPARPLVSGRLSERQVQLLVAVSFTASLLLALSTGSAMTVAFILLLLGSSLLYSDAIKRVTGLKNLFVGLWCGLLPWGAALDEVAALSILPAVLIIGLFVTQKELVADVYDRRGDAAAGLKTIPMVIGPKGGLLLVVAANVALWLLGRVAGDGTAILHLGDAANLVASVNVLAAGAVLVKMTDVTVRAYLALQKVFQISGCVALFAAIRVH